MSEDRLVTLILWVVLALGIASLAAVYVLRSEGPDAEPQPSAARQIEAKLPSTIAQHALPSPAPASLDADELLGDQPPKTPPTTTLPSPPPQTVIHEAADPNGTFYTAQIITEGIIIGRRGTPGDRADYYKLRATGPTMTLGLEPSLEESKTRFIMSVFDANRRLIGEDVGKTGPSSTLSVTPQATYYIKLDLNRAPIETPQYQLHVHFK
jgi:hypothetical protein